MKRYEGHNPTIGEIDQLAKRFSEEPREKVAKLLVDEWYKQGKDKDKLICDILNKFEYITPAEFAPIAYTMIDYSFDNAEINKALKENPSELQSRVIEIFEGILDNDYVRTNSGGKAELHLLALNQYKRSAIQIT